MKFTVTLIGLLMCCQAHAVNKCTDPDGSVVFQDAPCAGKGETLKVSPASGHATASSTENATKLKAEMAAINRRAEIQAAIERREPAIGMTETELLQAMGQPDRANLANYSGTPHHQLIYERGARTLYVYTDGGVVKAIQNSESVSSARKAPVRCLTPLEIKALETSASSITLGDKERAERRREIAEARRCGK